MARVLVIEDQIDSAEMLRDLLCELGHEVAISHRGDEAVAAARRFRPSVVLCDLGLPDLDGYGVAQALKADPLLAPTRLVVLSGYDGPDERARARAAGFDEHLVKPVDVSDLEHLLA